MKIFESTTKIMLQNLVVVVNLDFKPTRINVDTISYNNGFIELIIFMLTKLS